MTALHVVAICVAVTLAYCTGVEWCCGKTWTVAAYAVPAVVVSCALIVAAVAA